MITHSEYESAKLKFKQAQLALKEAKQVIDMFEKQENGKKMERLKELKRNDFVEYIGGRKTKNLTVGKKYRLTGDSFGSRIAIINDAGRRIIIQPMQFFKF